MPLHDNVLDYTRVDTDFEKAKDLGPEALGRFEEMCRLERKKLQQHRKDLMRMDWTTMFQDACAGKELTGRVRHNLEEMTIEGEDFGRGWTVAASEGPLAAAEKAIHAIRKGQSDMTDRLEEWQEMARTQTDESIRVLAEYEHSAAKLRKNFWKEFKSY